MLSTVFFLAANQKQKKTCQESCPTLTTVCPLFFSHHPIFHSLIFFSPSSRFSGSARRPSAAKYTYCGRHAHITLASAKFHDSLCCPSIPTHSYRISPPKSSKFATLAVLSQRPKCNRRRHPPYLPPRHGISVGKWREKEWT